MSATRTKPADRFPPGAPARNSQAAPPPPSDADRRTVKALVRSVAAKLRLGAPPVLEERKETWLESRPQALWPLLDAAVEAGSAPECDDHEITACHWLLATQLELIRYRLDRGYAWARSMLDEYQERLVTLGQANALPHAAWFQLVNLLQIAKVPVRPEMAEALALASGDASATDGSTPEPTPEEISRMFRGLLDELSKSAKSPFAVVEALAEAGALMPVQMRAYLVHEMGLSPHAVMREAVPLLLIDPEPAVRQAASSVLNQIAGPETVSPVMLRRILLLRNWVPAAERGAIDQVSRKLRLKGVACAQWDKPPAALALLTSVVDGSGAQNLILTTPKGRTGLFAGLLVKQGFGIRDAWCSPSAPRHEINAALNGSRTQMQGAATVRDHLDTVVQHHIARGLAEGHLPPVAAVEIAEAIGAADWKERGLDVAAEIAQRFAALAETERGAAAIAESLARSGEFVAYDPIAQSWFEDDPAIRALTGRGARRGGKSVQALLDGFLASRREIWAERLLLTILWLEAGAGSDRARGETVRDLTVLAHELLVEGEQGRPELAALPAMVVIATRSLAVAGAERW